MKCFARKRAEVQTMPGAATNQHRYEASRLHVGSSIAQLPKLTGDVCHAGSSRRVGEIYHRVGRDAARVSLRQGVRNLKRRHPVNVLLRFQFESLNTQIELTNGLSGVYVNVNGQDRLMLCRLRIAWLCPMGIRIMKPGETQNGTVEDVLLTST